MPSLVSRAIGYGFVILLAIPTWWFVVVSSAAPRTLDSGIYLSVAGALLDGASLYGDVLDNKDPLFYYALATALSGGSGVAQLLDILWFSCSAIGSWLLARTVIGSWPAAFTALIAVPLTMLGIAYQPGMTNLPGTALVLLAMGLLVSRVWWLSGVVLALALGMKITNAPIILGILVAAALIPHMRKRGMKAAIVMAGTLGAIALWMLISGTLFGYVEVIQRNLQYSGDVMVYFGNSPDVAGHFARLAPDMTLLRWATVSAIAVIGLLASVHWSKRTPSFTVLAVWLWISIAGVVAQIATTYVWDHHWQAVALPAVLALVTAVGIGNRVWGSWMWGDVLSVILAALLVFPMGGWLPPQRMLDKWGSENAEWSQWRMQLGDIPLEARLLRTVPLASFTFARLGTNDDGGFLTDSPEQARLGCPKFHLYDFSPPTDFADALDCLQTVDVVLVTDQFLVFGQGARAGDVAPITQTLDRDFTCLRVEDRQLCTRRSPITSGE